MYDQTARRAWNDQYLMPGLVHLSDLRHDEGFIRAVWKIGRNVNNPQDGPPSAAVATELAGSEEPAINPAR